MKNKSPNKKAIIYCRVSSKSQTREGHGLDSQEYRCREYAESRGYTIAAVFTDDRTGGGDFMERPGMVELLKYLDDHIQDKYVVIFDDLKRYARDTVFHLKLRSEMAMRNAERECLNFRFEDSPEGEFIETVLAAQAQLERKQNSRQVVQKMRARMMGGYWVLKAPRGYITAKVPGHGKMMVRHEPLATIVQSALEGFASDRFSSAVEIQAYFASNPDFPKDRKGGVHIQRVLDILKQRLYTGYYDFPEWNVPLMQGKHEPLISFETHKRIQDKMLGRAKVPARKDLNRDFALTGFILCDCCGRPLRSCWASGKYDKYPYYLCHTKDCMFYGKSIRREQVEGQFGELLKSITPAPATIEMVNHLIDELKDRRLNNHAQMIEELKKEKQQIEVKLERLVERVVSADSPTLVNAYERQIKQLEEQRIITTEKIRDCGKSHDTMQKINRTSLNLLQNPHAHWVSSDLPGKRLVLKATFAQPLAYHRNEGYRTPALSLPFSLLRGFDSQKGEMAHTSGISSNKVMQLMTEIDTLSKILDLKDNKPSR